MCKWQQSLSSLIRRPLSVRGPPPPTPIARTSLLGLSQTLHRRRRRWRVDDDLAALAQVRGARSRQNVAARDTGFARLRSKHALRRVAQKRRAAHRRCQTKHCGRCAGQRLPICGGARKETRARGRCGKREQPGAGNLLYCLSRALSRMSQCLLRKWSSLRGVAGAASV